MTFTRVNLHSKIFFIKFRDNLEIMYRQLKKEK